MKLLLKVVKDSCISQTIKVLMIYQIFRNSDLEKHKYMQWHRIVIDAIKFKLENFLLSIQRNLRKIFVNFTFLTKLWFNIDLPSLLDKTYLVSILKDLFYFMNLHLHGSVLFTSRYKFLNLNLRKVCVQHNCWSIFNRHFSIVRNCLNSLLKHSYHGHKITDDHRIIKYNKLRKLFTKSSKYHGPRK